MLHILKYQNIGNFVVFYLICVPLLYVPCILLCCGLLSIGIINGDAHMVFNNWAMDRGFFCIFLIFVLLYVFILVLVLVLVIRYFFYLC